MAMAVTARSRILVLLILLSFALSLAIATSGLFKGFELKAYDLLSRTCNPPKAPESYPNTNAPKAAMAQAADAREPGDGVLRTATSVIEFPSRNHGADGIHPDGVTQRSIS